MKRWLASALAVVVLVAAAFAILSYTQDELPTDELILTEIQGEVRVTGEDGKSEVGVSGRPLDPKDRVTTGLTSRAMLSMGDNWRVRLDPASTVKVIDHNDKAVTLELEGGALQATVRAGPTALRIGSNGREVVATDASFEMGVGEDGLLVVEVTEGAAGTSGMTGIAQLHAGERATVTGEGAGVVSPVTSELLLAVTWPEAGRTKERTQRVSGTTAPGARVNVRGGGKIVQVTADLAGRFEIDVPLVEGDNVLAVDATDVLGKVASVDGVTVQLKTKPAVFSSYGGGTVPQ